MNAIRKYDGEIFGIKVETKKAASFYGYNFDESTGELGKAANNDYLEAKKETSSSYINPNGRFQGTIIRDCNGTITGLKFVQQ